MATLTVHTAFMTRPGLHTQFSPTYKIVSIEPEHPDDKTRRVYVTLASLEPLHGTRGAFENPCSLEVGDIELDFESASLLEGRDPPVLVLFKDRDDFLS